MGATARRNPASTRLVNLDSVRRRTAFVDHLRQGRSIGEACDAVGIKRKTYDSWRQLYPAFKAAVLEARAAYASTVHRGVTGSHGATAGFLLERQDWFNHATPGFQIEVNQAIDELPAGSVLLVLLPPEHGKTTWFEDRACWTLTHDPAFRFHVASESIGLSRKILGRIQRRMDPGVTPYPDWVMNHGPFMPQPGQRQTWTTDYCNVFHRSGSDERDYSLAALGFGSQIIGSRSDWLHGDDIQSLKTLNRTDVMLETIRQDWFSRTGETGINSFFGNRIADEDIYGALDEALDPDLCRVIRYPAIVADPEGQPAPLWPQRWSLPQLDRMERKVGPLVWERNWMQITRGKKAGTFDGGDFDRCLHPLHSIESRAEPGQSAIVTLDPALGSINAMAALAPTPDGLMLVGLRQANGLRSNEAILAHLGDFCRHVQGRGFMITDCVIEAKNFQAGLARDERLAELRAEFGFAVREHLTGINKYDENIGVPSMITTMVKRRFIFPGYGDEASRLAAATLRAQFEAWRPYKSGAKLRQDLVMAVWFGWILWRSRHEVTHTATPSAWSSRSVPGGGTLYVPSRAMV